MRAQPNKHSNHALLGQLHLPKGPNAQRFGQLVLPDLQVQPRVADRGLDAARHRKWRRRRAVDGRRRADAATRVGGVLLHFNARGLSPCLLSSRSDTDPHRRAVKFCPLGCKWSFPSSVGWSSGLARPHYP